MTTAEKPRILIVDDEEAILETMTYTFEEDYEVHTSSDARVALTLLEEKGPFAAVLTDQRMPNMTGVEFLSHVYQRHPTTVRIILTGFADMDAILRAINDGHVYAYITKPWEPDQLKQVVRRAVEHHRLSEENLRLLEDLQRSKVILDAVMDRLGTGAIALDAAGVVQAANRPASQYLGIAAPPHGRRLEDVLPGPAWEAVRRLEEGSGDGRFEELELASNGRAVRLRLSLSRLAAPTGGALGEVVLLREISHEPLRRRFEELLRGLAEHHSSLREPMEHTAAELRRLVQEVRATRVASPGMEELAEHASRTLTAIENWLAVDDALAAEAYPDAQVLLDRMRIALARWPLPEALPRRVRELAQRVESYYESGENPRARTL